MFTGVDGQGDGTIRYRSATDGHLLGPPVGIQGAPGELLGWLDDNPVLSTVRGGDERRVSLDVLRADGDQDTLVQGPPGSTGMDVPRDLISPGAFGAPGAYPSALAAAPWMYAAAVTPILLALAWLRRKRRRGNRGEQPASRSTRVG